MATRVASTRLIGRAAELEELEAALADAAAGRPALAFVAGDSGVGKTRLLDELERRARDGGALVLTGDAVDLGGEAELPYLPLVAALRPLARAGDPALSEAIRDAIAPLLPGEPARATGPDAQARLFEGLLALLDALGRDRPVLLVIEDLHWADRSTRAALAFLARSLTGERVAVVCSYRPDELDRRHPLRPLLAELEREPRARRLAVGPLTRDELAAQLADILGEPPAADLLERLWARSGGNPLFGEELLAAGLDGRGAAPATLRDALMLRVDRLSETARELLRVVAVAERLDDPLLEATSGLEPRALRDAAREAVDGHILVAEADGMYRFRHALLREVVEADLLPGERAELHLALARTLEERLDEASGAQATAAVAHHFAAAGDEPAALRTAVRAASDAARVHAYGETVTLLERALALWDRVPDPAALAGAGRIALLVRAAEAAEALGDPARQLALLEAALAALGPRGEPDAAARILESIARAQRHLNRGPAGIATLERALDLVGEDGGDPSVRASLLANLGRALMLSGRFGEAVRTAEQALAAAPGGPLVEGHARNTLGFSIAMTGSVDEGAAQLRAAIEIAREHASPSDLALAYINYADVLQAAGRSADARAVATEGRRAVEGIRPGAVTWLDVKLAEFAFDAGEWDEAEAVLPVSRVSSSTQTRLGVGLRLAALALGRGDHAAAAALLEHLEPLGAESSEPAALVPLGVVVTELRRRQGDLDAARAAVDLGIERIESAHDEGLHAAALAAAGVTVEADAAERARDLGDAEAESAAVRRAGELVARVAAAAAPPEAVPAGAGSPPDGQAARSPEAVPEGAGSPPDAQAGAPPRPVERALLAGARADAARAAGRPEAVAYAEAAAAWEAIGRPDPAARMRLRAAEAHVAGGDREAAASEAREARAVAVRIGAAGLRDEIDGLAARARLALIEHAADDAAAEPEPPPEDAFGLTARERQVLALLAEGATNREIGAALFMAPKTASVHVSRILAKLDVRTRTEAAAVAHRHGLAQQDG